MRTNVFLLAHCGATVLLACLNGRPRATLSEQVRPADRPYAAAGDRCVARAVGQKLGDAFGQQVIITIARAPTAISAPTWSRKPTPTVTRSDGVRRDYGHQSAAYSKLPFDPVKDFAPITKVAAAADDPCRAPSFPPNNTKELFLMQEQARLNTRRRATQARAFSDGCVEQRTGTQFTHIAYKGGGQAVIDVLAGQFRCSRPRFRRAGAYKGGKIKGIALTSARRHASLRMSHVAEAGINRFRHFRWYGLLAPAGTPRAVVMRVHDETVKILATPEMEDRFQNTLGARGRQHARAVRANIRDDIERWGKIVRQTGIKLE